MIKKEKERSFKSAVNRTNFVISVIHLFQYIAYLALKRHQK